MAKDLAKQDKQTKQDEFDLFGGDTMTMVMMMVMMVAVVSQFLGPLTQTAKAQTQALAAQSFSGNEDPRSLNVTNRLNWINLIYSYPFQPWISAYVINDGPSAVEVGINYPDDRFTILPGETITITRSGAEERIKIVFFVCTVGLRSTLRVTGVY